MDKAANFDFKAYVRELGEMLVKNAEDVVGTDKPVGLLEISMKVYPNVIPVEKPNGRINTNVAYDLVNEEDVVEHNLRNLLICKLRKAGDYLIRNADHIVGDVELIRFKLHIECHRYDEYDCSFFITKRVK